MNVFLFIFWICIFVNFYWYYDIRMYKFYDYFIFYFSYEIINNKLGFDSYVFVYICFLGFWECLVDVLGLGILIRCSLFYYSLLF